MKHSFLFACILMAAPLTAQAAGSRQQLQQAKHDRVISRAMRLCQDELNTPLCRFAVITVSGLMKKDEGLSREVAIRRLLNMNPEPKDQDAAVSILMGVTFFFNAYENDPF